MSKDNIQKNLVSEIQKESVKAKLNRFTEENDRLVKSLKKPSGSLKAA